MNILFMFLLFPLCGNTQQIQTVDYNEPSISALFLSIDSICNIKNSYQQNTDRLMNDLTNYFSSCSHGKITLSPNSLIVKGISLPCSVNTTCGVDVLSTWAQQAQEFAKKIQINIQNYNHFILLLPQMPFCNWGGLSTLAPCLPNCLVWINGNAINTQSALIHEIGHNFGLQHAATYGNDYGDTSCAMGAYSSNRCYNVFSQARLKWNNPIQILQLNSNQVNNFVIPSSLFSTSNYIVLTLNSSDSLLISFRTPNIGYDKNLFSMYVNRLSIHHIRGLYAVRAYLIYVLPVLSTWNGNAYFNELSITFTSYNIDTSYVEIKTGIQSIQSILCGDHICQLDELKTCPIDCPFSLSNVINYC